MASSGQVDVIISKQAIDEIAKATADLELLSKKILAVNTASAKGGGGVKNNKELNLRLQKTNQLVTATNKLIQVQSKELASIKRNTTATKSNTKAKKGATKTTLGLGMALKGLGLLMIAQKTIQFSTSIFNLSKQFESLKFALDRTAKNAREAGASFNFVVKLSNDLGISLLSTSNRFIKFASAARLSGLAMKDTQKIFGTMAKAGAVLGLQTDEMSGIFLALEQMLSKGKVTTEELRRQLGERLPGAFAIMASSLDVTLPQLDEMLKTGKILSAEVLPGFADAVEIAFGLDKVDKIDTLAAAQGKLTTSWQQFIAKLTDSERFLNKFFKNTLKLGKVWVEGMNLIFNYDQTQAESIRATWLEIEKDGIEERAKTKLEATKKNGKKFADLELAQEEAYTAFKNSINDKALEEQFRKKNNAVLKYKKELDIIIQKDAEKVFKEDLQAVINQEKKIAKAKEELAEARVTTTKFIDSGYGGQVPVTSRKEGLSEITERERKIKSEENRLQKLLGKLDASRFLGEESKSPSITPKKTKKTGIDTSDIDAAISALKRLKEIEKQKIEDTKLSNKERLIAQEEFFKLSRDIEDLGYDKQLRLAGENNNKRTTAANNLSTSLLNINQKAQQDLISLTQSFIDDQVKEIKEANDEILNIEIQNIKAKYALKGKLTKKQQKKLDDELAEVKRVSNNKSLTEQAALMQKEFELMVIDGDIKIALKRRIEKTLAGIVGEKPKDDPKEKEVLTEKQEQFISDMEMAQNFADALGGLGNAIFDKKIANIDAEIAAEEAKYETLFALAEGDANLERRLRIEQEEDREKLEKKKMAMQKKQAKFNKAQALIDIAINTAIWVTKVGSETGIFGIALAPLVLALGAIQAATVLAQPLPAFAEGGVMGHDGVALVGDGGQREVMRTPDGKLSVTPASNTLVNIPKGTEIFPSIADFNNEQPSYLDDKIYSATLLASISLNQKSIEGMMFTQRELDQRLLDEMIRNTNAVKKSKSNVNLKTQSIDIPHAMWRNNFTS